MKKHEVTCEGINIPRNGVTITNVQFLYESSRNCWLDKNYPMFELKLRTLLAFFNLFGFKCAAAFTCFFNLSGF
jgi:hypothetical protein